MQVVHVQGESSIDDALSYAETVDALLLDSGNTSLAIKELGGTGWTHDRSVSRRIIEQSPMPVFLAGGIGPHNVVESVEKVKPFGIDLCSSVRTDGMLDEAKLEVLFQAVKTVRGY